MAQGRLDVDAPELAQLVSETAGSPRLAVLLMRACEGAVATSGISDPLIQQALLVVAGGQADASLGAALSDLADRLDSAYLDAQERGDDNWVGLFRQARAASAMAQAVLSDDAATAAEAIYEAAHASENRPAFYCALVR